MDKPTSGTEIKHDGFRTLLMDSLDLSEQNLDAFEGLSHFTPNLLSPFCQMGISPSAHSRMAVRGPEAETG